MYSLTNIPIMARVNPHASSLSAESTSNTASSKEDNAGGLFSKLARNIRTFKLFTTPAENASRQSCTEGNKSVQNKSIDHQRIQNSQETKNNVSSLGKMKPIPSVSCSSYEEYQTAIEEVPSPVQSLGDTKTKELSTDISNLTSQLSALKLHPSKISSKSDTSKQTTVQPYNPFLAPLKDITTNRIIPQQTCLKAPSKRTTKVVTKRETITKENLPIQSNQILVRQVSTTKVPSKQTLTKGNSEYETLAKENLSNCKTRLKDTSSKENISKQEATLKAPSKPTTKVIQLETIKKEDLSKQVTRLKDSTTPKQIIPKQNVTLKASPRRATKVVKDDVIKNEDQVALSKNTSSKQIPVKKAEIPSNKTKVVIKENLLEQPGTTKEVPTNASVKSSTLDKKSTLSKISTVTKNPVKSIVTIKEIPSKGLSTLKLVPEKGEIQEKVTSSERRVQPQKNAIANQPNNIMTRKSVMQMNVEEISHQLAKTHISKTSVCEKSVFNTQPSVIANRKYAEERQYTNVPIDPQVHEILSDPPTDIQANVVRGSYKSPVHYLNVQVKLLREDCMASLRDGIQQMRRELLEYGDLSTNEHITLYPNCRFICKSLKKKIVGYEFCFDADLLSTSNRWRLSKSLFTGALLAFSCDGFKTFFFGVVARTDQHDMLNRRVIIVELYNGKQLEYSDFNRSYSMVEPSSFFAPYYYVIKTLQTLSNENFPFEQYVINARRNINRPIYLYKDRRILDEHDLSSNVETQLGLNSVQFEAYKTALTKELAIIQGPPGTGKTYVGLRIVEGFLKNKRLRNYMDGPILIVCYTNHALDQFVQGVLRYTQNVCRLGYSRTNSIVRPYNHLEMIETFMAMKAEVKAYREGVGVEMEDFDNIFKPDLQGYYTLLVKSFKTELYEQRKYSLHLLKAYFFMYVRSPFNEIGSGEQAFVRNMCYGIEKTSSRIREKISLIHAYNGIVAVKYLEDFMDHISSGALSGLGALDGWLTNGISKIETKLDNGISKLDNGMSDCDSEYSDYECDMTSDSDVSIDRVKNVFYTIDLTDIRNDIENTESEIEDLKNQNGRVHNVPYLRVENPYQKEMKLRSKLIRLRELCDLVESNLSLIKQDNLNMEEIKSTLVKKILNKKYLYGLCIEDRWKLYWYWIQCYKRKLYSQMESQSTEYKDILEDYMEVVRNPEFIQVLKTKDVVAMTTTKAAKIHPVLCELKPKIVVIEEAAEVLEAHIIASLSQHCEHLVLIGDHKQLRPRTNVHSLAREYKLDVSLFERLVNNGLHHVTLEVQHRMRPEICELLTPYIYSNLFNHPSVNKLSSVRGMAGNVQFFNHKVYEGSKVTEHSTWNVFEVNILLKLAHYLLKQGYRPREITIIAAYGGQKELFETTIENQYKLLSKILVTTIDGFQGEENKIILLSLVRSNIQNKIGFLKTPNRVCVALSRAKHGLYIVGNMKCLSMESDLWQNINNKLIARRAISDGFSLNCGRHRKSTTVRSVEEFDNACCLRW